MNRSNEENKRFSVRLLVELIRAVKEKRDEPRHSRIPAQFVEEIFAGDVWSTEILGRAGFERVDDEFRFNGQKTDDELSDLIDFLVQIDESFDKQREETSFDELKRICAMSPLPQIGWKSQFELVRLNENCQLKQKIIEEIIPVELLKSRISKTNLDESQLDEKDLLVVELAHWFKEEYFQWFDTPDCETCQRPMDFHRFEAPTEIEAKRDLASRVELYRCSSCGSTDRFVRYNKIDKLIETRRGRCGEATNLFHCFLRCLSIDCRYIHDPSDHVWVEFFSEKLKRWIHCDPSEDLVDSPLVYQHGWKKDISFCLAFSIDHVEDVTWRYVSDFPTVVRRRRTDERQLSKFIGKINRSLGHRLDSNRRSIVVQRRLNDLVSMLTQRRQAKSDELSGRTSGSLQWRTERGETNRSTEVMVGFVHRIRSDLLDDESRWTIEYDSLVDVHLNNGVKEDAPWKQRVFLYKNIQRKVERDWKMVYLCREKNFDEGILRWKFETDNKSALFTSLELFCPQTKFDETSRLDLSLLLPDGRSQPLEFENNFSSSFRFENGGTNEFFLDLRFSNSSDNEDPNGWQKYQICRQSLRGSADQRETKDFFRIRLTLRR